MRGESLKEKGFMKRKGRKRLSMDIPEGIHRELVKACEKRNCTITRYVLRGIIALLKQETKYI